MRGQWLKAAGCESAYCVEVMFTPDGETVLMRDSKDGRILTFSMAEWTAFESGVKAGDFKDL